MAKHAPDNFIPALKKIAEVFQEIPFAEYCQREQEMYMEQRLKKPEKWQGRGKQKMRFQK